MKLDTMTVGLLLKTVLVPVCCLAFFACADKPQNVRLIPDIPVIESNQGKGKMITVKVIDRRPNSIIGYRGSSSISNGGEITLNQSLEKLVLYESIKGLMKKGFNPLVSKSGESPVLTIEIQEFKYYTSTSFWTGAVHTKATIKAMAVANRRHYANAYTVNNEKRNVVVTTASQNEEVINEMLNDILQKLLDDNQLIEFMGTWVQ
ncbi:MAG: hypothetical protein HQK62_07630 [Desulfamplus sp.]|nr:hypothetical protein [Desulfamplus sp.]MBF0258692.1 hypothetical protein [Desulfamplus sp.]